MQDASSDVGPRVKGTWKKPWLNDRGHSLETSASISALTTPQIQALTTTEIAVLTNSQLQAITTTGIVALNATQVGAIAADSVTATIDYTYSRNTVQVRNSNVGIWFNFNDVSSSWTDGPVAGPNFYTERFGVNEGKDLSYSGSLTENRSENKSLGGNIAWDGPGGLRLELDAHHSTAESGANNPYGTSTSVGTAIFGVQSQTIKVEDLVDMRFVEAAVKELGPYKRAP